MPARSLLRAFLVALGIAACVAVDAPRAVAQSESVDGFVLRIRHGEEIVLDFVSRDRDFPFPEPRSGDDPALSGATVTILVPRARAFHDLVPSGEIWRASPSHRVHRFVNRADSAPTRRLTLNDRGRFRLKMRLPSGALGRAPLGSVGLKVRVGGVTACALFDGEAVRRDDAAVFFARRASGDALDDDCSNPRLGETTCATESGFPACGGTCPGGGTCRPYGDVHSPYQTQTCICEEHCGGICPEPSICALNGSNSWGCALVRCGELGDYPSCGGGGCGPWECRPIALRLEPADTVLIEGCGCAPPGFCEDASGYACSRGEACEVRFEIFGPSSRSCVDVR